MTGKHATQRLTPDDEGIARAAAILGRGGLVAVPTETVYGLAARADSAQAVAAIYAAKGRPDFNPLIVHVRDALQAARYARLPAAAIRATDRFWPGPLTLVVPARAGAGLAPAVTAGLATLALRAPAHAVMRSLLEQVDFPLAAPSANLSGAISPTSASHVLDELNGRIDAVIDAGPTPQGLESTIIALRDAPHARGWEILRPGPISEEQLAGVLGPASISRPGKLEAPGQMASHYAPGKPVRLDAQEAAAGEFLIGFGKVAGDCSLSAAGDLAEAAARLYDCLHQARASHLPLIAVAPVPATGIGIAINDRLKRAAA